MDIGLAFLGINERAALVRDGNSNLYKWNIIGLKNHVFTHIFPISLIGWGLTLAIRSDSHFPYIKLNIVDELKVNVGSIEIKQGEPLKQEEEISMSSEQGAILFLPEEGWTVVSFPIKDAYCTILQPGDYFINVETDEGDVTIGQLRFHLVDPPKLTTEKIAAIKSSPLATKAVRIGYPCNTCKDTLRAYAALEKEKKLEAEGYAWYENIDDEFTCSCGKQKIDSTYIKRNLHGLLGIKDSGGKQIGLVPMYERSVLEQIESDFEKLINKDPLEEDIQKYIQINTILLHQFPADKIIFKPPLLNKYKADFAILTPQKELIFIEIERAKNTRLLNKKGDVAAPLNHAFDQVRDWLFCIDEHRQAILADLNIDKENVSQIKGVVIAGIDSGYDAGHLRKLKGGDWGKISFLTYDDLISSLQLLTKNVHSL